LPPRQPVGGMLRPAGRGIFPVFLAAVRCEVGDVADEHEPVHAAGGGAVGPVDVFAVAQEHGEHEAAACAAVVSERRAVRLAAPVQGHDEQGMITGTAARTRSTRRAPAWTTWRSLSRTARNLRPGRNDWRRPQSCIPRSLRRTPYRVPPCSSSAIRTTFNSSCSPSRHGRWQPGAPQQGGYLMNCARRLRPTWSRLAGPHAAEAAVVAAEMRCWRPPRCRWQGRAPARRQGTTSTPPMQRYIARGVPPGTRQQSGPRRWPVAGGASARRQRRSAGRPPGTARSGHS
jgi:hypothetical protein